MRRLIAVLACAGGAWFGASQAALAAGWMVVATPDPARTSSSQDVLDAVAQVPGSNTFWAAGWVSTASGSSTLVMHTTASGWAVSPTPAGGDSQVYGIASAGASRALAVGATGVVRTRPLVLAWNGSTWAAESVALPAGMGGSLSGVRAFSASNAVAVGEWFSFSGGGQGPLVARWNGTSWTAVEAPNPAGCEATFDAVARVPGSSTVIAVGSCLGRSAAAPLAEEWVAGGWRVMHLPGPTYGALYAIAATASGQMWAVGQAGGGRNGQMPTTPLIERWNGRAWSVVASPAVSGSVALESVVCVPGSATVWATGRALTGATTSRAISERWTGAKWTLVPPVQPTAANDLLGVAASASAGWAGGTSTPAGGRPQIATLAERWAG